MKKTNSRVQIIRRAIQIIAFLLIPGLFAEAFSGVKTIFLALFRGEALELSQVFPALLLIIAALLLGRFFCGWLCAFGTFGDMLRIIGKKLFRIKFKMPEKLDGALKYLKYVLLAFLVFTCAFGIEAFSEWSPWDAFGVLGAIPPDIAYALSAFMPGVIILIVIMIGSLFVERFFCRYLCPMGAVLSAVSFFKTVKIKKGGEECGKCKACTSSCAMGIPMYKHSSVSSGECIGCMKCIDPCPRGNTRLTAFSRGLAQLFAAFAAVFLIGLYYAGVFGIDALKANAKPEYYVAGNAASDTAGAVVSPQPSEKASAQTVTKTASAYKDGTYSGTGIGYKNQKTTVNVTVSNGKITAIDTVSTGDTPQYYSRAFSTIVSGIISKQSTSVDTVSGATFTSKGIISAVSNALSQAKN